MTANLLKLYETHIESVTLLPSDGGKYEVSVNGKLIYSKLQTGRHADFEEVEKLVFKALNER